MKWTISRRSALRTATLAWAVALAVTANCAVAGPLTTFTLDVTNSILTASGLLSVGNTTLPIRSQAPGSLLTTLEGQILADITPGVSIEFPGGATVMPIQQPGAFLPGSAPADMAGRVLNILPGISAFGAFRNDVLTFGSLSPLALSGSTFDAGGVQTGFVSGLFDYEVTSLFSNTYVLDGGSLVNEPGLVGQLNNLGSLYQLILPIQSSLVLQEEGFTLQLEIEGRVVAYGEFAVPEPSTWTLALLGTALAGWGWRRRR